MASSFVQILANDKLTGENYGTWKSNLNTILVLDDLRFVLTEDCPPTPSSNGSRTVREAYDRWIRANDKARVYILASMQDVLAKRHEVMVSAKEIMFSLQEMFGQPSSSLRHEALKFVYNARMKEGTSVREHVLNMMVHFMTAEVNGAAIDEKSQVSFILESLPQSFLNFRSNMVMNKIEFNLTTLLHELQTYQTLHASKGKEKEANVVTSKKFLKGAGSGSKSEATATSSRTIRKKKRNRRKGKAPVVVAKVKSSDKGKCFHCNEEGHWKRNCQKYLAEKHAEKERQGN